MFQCGCVRLGGARAFRELHTEASQRGAQEW